LATDKLKLDTLKKVTALYLAWTKLNLPRETANFDEAQKKIVTTNIGTQKIALATSIKETYNILIIPISAENNIDTKFTDRRLNKPSSDDFFLNISNSLKKEELVIDDLSASNIHLDLEKFVWKKHEHISIESMWTYMSSYLYFSRLNDENVLCNAISKGLKSGEYFSLATSFDGTLYVDLKLRDENSTLNYSKDKSKLIVKLDVAKKQSELEPEIATVEDEKTIISDNNSTLEPSDAAKKRFFMTANLVNIDPKKEPKYDDIYKTLDNLSKNILKELKEQFDGFDFEVSLEVASKSKKGFSEETIKTITSRCAELKITDFGFEND
jgi:hypothetical protein